MKDFSRDKYKQLCVGLLNSGYDFLTLNEFINIQNDISLNSKKVVIRHDLCRNAAIGTLGLLEVEAELNIKTSYYFRNPESYDFNMIEKVAKYGHEIGVHYDCLDKAKGNYERAKQILSNDLNELRNIACVQTVAMHGNPLTKWDNRDIFNKYPLNDFKLNGESYLSVDFEKIFYYTDTGRNWSDTKNNVKEFIPNYSSNTTNKPEIYSTDELISKIKNMDANLYFLIHPNRWRSSLSGYYYKYFQDYFKNMIKRLYTKVK